MGTQLILGTAVTVANVVFHVIALTVLLVVINRIAPGIESRTRLRVGATVLLITAVLGIILVHTIEVWGWALLYMALGEFDSLTQALYFSVATATTVGYGDVVLSTRWQLLGTFESMAGLILFGVSTAYLFRLIGDLFSRIPAMLRKRD